VHVSGGMTPAVLLHVMLARKASRNLARRWTSRQMNCRARVRRRSWRPSRAQVCQTVFAPLQQLLPNVRPSTSLDMHVMFHLSIQLFLQ
jgi:hypothetical protein